MTSNEPLLPDDDSRLVAVNLQLRFIAPRTLRGALGMFFLRLAKMCGVEPELDTNGMVNERFGDLPTHVRDEVVVDILTAPPNEDGTTLIRKKKSPDPE